MSYYFVSVGGSGARVLESLTHLAVAGLLPNEYGDGLLYITCVDPDTGNGNLARTNILLDHVINFRGVDVRSDTPLFKTPIEINDSVWSITKLNTSLDDVTSWQTYKEKSIGKLYESLYTKDERTELLNKGFRGRPSIGAAVMGMNATADESGSWANFISKVKGELSGGKEARIFLAGSIFGGTGAAGLPTIAKLLRDEFKVYEKSLSIGALLLLPYFSFSPTDDEKKECGLYASAENFLTNTKAALHYYADNGSSLFDSMYFVGDDVMEKTPNFSIGAGTQQNDAHIVDLFGAFAAAHFYQGEKGQHCYSISRNAEGMFTWQDLPTLKTEKGVKIPVKERFVQFVRFIFAYLAFVKPTLPDLVDGGYAKSNTGLLQRIFGNNRSKDNIAWYTDYWKDRIDIKDTEVSHFEQYAEKFVRWLSQTETYGREVKLIDPKAFKIDGDNIFIEEKLFDKLDFIERKIDINTVKEYLNDHGSEDRKGKSGYGGSDRAPAGTKQEFGLFLRRLYDACEVKVK